MAPAARLEALLARHWWQPRPTLLAQALRPLSWLYAALALVAAWRRAQRAPVPVVVVGNLVAGGAGKTPTVIALVQALQRAGHRPGVISRGHGRSGDDVRPVGAGSMPADVGDEPLLIERRCAVPVWVGRRRAEAARALCRAHPEVDVLVSDDGLQHAALARDAEWLVFDERGVGNGLLLPAGPLRQPLPARLAANQRVVYNADAATTPLPGVFALRQAGSVLPLAAWLAGSREGEAPLSALRGRPLLAAAGIASPQRFFGMLEAAGLELRRLPLPDHFDYASLPWPATTAEVVTTEKDAVKLHHAIGGPTKIWVVGLDFALPQNLIAELLPLL